MEASSGTSGFRDLEFQERLGRVFELLTVPQPWKTQEHVRRHLDHGLVRRLRMIEHCVLTLAQLPPDGSLALGLYKVEEVNVALNALFLNLRGCLDNAAWALTHHYQLVDSPSERKRKHRAFADLFGAPFLKALSEHDEELATRLEAMAQWGRELSAVRDPAAHRIPLYIPPAILDEEGVAKVKAIDDQMAEAASNKDWNTFHTLTTERWNVGPFRWGLTLSEQEGLKLVSLAAVLNRDIGGLLDAVELVARFVFAEDTWTSAVNCGPLPRRERARSGSSPGST